MTLSTVPSGHWRKDPVNSTSDTLAQYLPDQVQIDSDSYCVFRYTNCTHLKTGFVDIYLKLN